MSAVGAFAVKSAQQDADYTERFEDVRLAELQWIEQRRAAVGNIPERSPLVGLALSGGGIRSAAFNLGVLQALARKRLLQRIDYLSSVSGGGYIASCLTWLATHSPDAASRFDALALPNGGGTVLDWLRAHGRYLITGRGLSGWSLSASILAGTLLNLFVLLPLLLVAIGLASYEWLALSWPANMHLPGAAAVHAHDGFMLIALAGVLLLILYLLTAVLFALSTALSPLRRMAADPYFRRGLGQLLAGGIIAIAVGVLPILVGIEEAVLAYVREQGMRDVVRHASWLGPTLAGGVSMWLANTRAVGSRALPIIGLSLLLYGGFTALYHLAHHTPLLSSELFQWWLLCSLLLAVVCDINAISMHSYYRSRLAEAFLPEIDTQDLHGEDRNHPMLFRIADIRAGSGAAFHIVNTTLNTTSSRNPTLRSRNGDNLALTPLFCGSTATGYRRTASYLKGELTLATAFSVSGAAVDPDTYATRSRPVSFLMTLLNVRLGVWLANPRKRPRKLRWPAWYQLMLREMLGIGLSETHARIHLSDGGHFENLGAFELLRRRCRYIVISDAGADPHTTLADLGQLAQRARADFGASIEMSADAFFSERDEALRSRSHLLGKVTYADGSTGEILYLKALLRKDLSADIYAYWRLNPAFPNEPTSNQFYGELQFDSYRELGLQLMSGIIGDEAEVTLEEVFARWRERDGRVVALQEHDVA